MQETPQDLKLTTRRGLPDEMAYLRASHPPATWRAHANYGALSAFWLDVHSQLRTEGDALAVMTRAFRGGTQSAVGFQQQFMPQLAHHLQHLDGHHHIEDAHYFPRFRALDRRMVVGFDLLENDHDIIHRELRATAESARVFLGALTRGPDAQRFAANTYADDADRLLRLLDRHLADEEDLVIPAMLEHGERAVR